MHCLFVYLACLYYLYGDDMGGMGGQDGFWAGSDAR